jgi:RNA polymerase sigma-70 factor (TIGR02943 family)
MATSLSHQMTQTIQVDPLSWLDQHGDHLFRYAMLRLWDLQAAEELVQQTLLAAIKGQADFRGASSEITWLLGILRHKILDRLREVSRLRPLNDVEPFVDLDFQENGNWQGASAPIPWRAKPDELIKQEEFWDKLNRGLSSLPARTATAFILREIDCVSADEICDVLNVSQENLLMMLHRARLSLRRFLQINWFGAPRRPSKTAGRDWEMSLAACPLGLL